MKFLKDDRKSFFFEFFGFAYVVTIHSLHLQKTAMFMSPLPSVPPYIMQLRPRKEWTSFAMIFP